MDIRSAGTNPPNSFTDILVDTGSGFVSAGFNLSERSFTANGTFVPFTLDLSGMTGIENQPTVSLRFEIPDLSSNPVQSFRVDNIQMAAVPEPSSAVMLLGGVAALSLLHRRR